MSAMTGRAGKHSIFPAWCGELSIPRFANPRFGNSFCIVLCRLPRFTATLSRFCQGKK